MNNTYRYWFLLLVVALTLNACHHSRTYFPKDLEPQQIDLVRFDNALMNVQEATIQEDVRLLYEEFPVFMPLWVEDILGIPSTDTAYLEQQLPLFLNDTLYGFKETNKREKAMFADVKDVERSLGQAFARIRYLYPETQIPTLYLFISGFQTPVYFSEDLIGIGG